MNGDRSEPTTFRIQRDVNQVNMTFVQSLRREVGGIKLQTHDTAASISAGCKELKICS
jgi:hypothetical protein